MYQSRNELLMCAYDKYGMNCSSLNKKQITTGQVVFLSNPENERQGEMLFFHAKQSLCLDDF